MSGHAGLSLEGGAGSQRAETLLRTAIKPTRTYPSDLRTCGPQMNLGSAERTYGLRTSAVNGGAAGTPHPHGLCLAPKYWGCQVMGGASVRTPVLHRVRTSGPVDLGPGGCLCLVPWRVTDAETSSEEEAG